MPHPDPPKASPTRQQHSEFPPSSHRDSAALARDSLSADNYDGPHLASSSVRSVSAPALTKTSRPMGAGSQTKNGVNVGGGDNKGAALMDMDLNSVPTARTCVGGEKERHTVAAGGKRVAQNGSVGDADNYPAEIPTSATEKGDGNTEFLLSYAHAPDADVQGAELITGLQANGGATKKSALRLRDGDITPTIRTNGLGFPNIKAETEQAAIGRPKSLSIPHPGLGISAKRPAQSPLERPGVHIEPAQNEGLSKGHAGEQTRLPRDREKEKVLKLSPAKIRELTSSPESLALHTIPADLDVSEITTLGEDSALASVDGAGGEGLDTHMGRAVLNGIVSKEKDFRRRKSSASKNAYLEDPPDFLSPGSARFKNQTPRQVSMPDASRGRRQTTAGVDRFPHTWNPKSKQDRRLPNHLNLDSNKGHQTSADGTASHMPPSIPLPPFSVPTYLQLELSSGRPSPLYIHRSATSDFPYESSQVKLERLLNFLLLPPLLEQVLLFGTLACLDSWLYSFTILPLRFCKSVFILLQSWGTNLGAEAQFISSFVIKGVGRVWRRRKRSGSSAVPIIHGPENAGKARPHQNEAHVNGNGKNTSSIEDERRARGSISRNKHRRKKSSPSALLPDDKADILKGLLMISTCVVLMYFDASRMYHWIRGQAAIKLYVIYNVLEVGDRLLSAIGQDVLECLFSREALERKPDGRSKVLRPFWLFLLALAYTVTHSTALFYQVITLNVAVNSYSNALITLLLSNQFVEIKSTVFKKFEKENLFQLTCADVVERFQLWLMLTIIASRNIVETNSFNLGNSLGTFVASNPSPITNSTPLSNPPHSASSILPQSFTLFPSSVFSSLSSVNSFLPSLGHVLGPFLVVLGSEMLVDWLKHAYINKFNNNRPAIYGRFLDVLTKDYYTNAFADQNLTRRLGLPVIPLSCLFFRVSVQTYKMFLTAWLPQPPSTFAPPSNTTSLSSIHNHYSPSPSPSSSAFSPFPFAPIPASLSHISSLFQTLISHATPSPNAFIPIFTVILILLLYVTLLLAKLILGIILLSFSRARYKTMKTREREHTTANGVPPSASSTSSTYPKSSQPIPAPTSAPPSTSTDSDMIEGARRFGGWGAVEVDEDKRRWIYADDPDGLKRLKEREERNKKEASLGAAGGMQAIESVKRYEMVAKRIW